MLDPMLFVRAAVELDEMHRGVPVDPQGVRKVAALDLSQGIRPSVLHEILKGFSWEFISRELRSPDPQQIAFLRTVCIKLARATQRPVRPRICF